MSSGAPSFVAAGIDAAVFHVDSVAFEDSPLREYSITGWCGDANMRPYEQLWLQADGQRVPCLIGLERSDVARELQRSSMRRCGFSARIHVSGPDSRLQFFDAESGGRRVFGIWNARQWVAERSGSPAEIQEPALGPAFAVVVTGSEVLHAYYRHRCHASLCHQVYDKWERVSEVGAAIEGEFALFLDARDELHPHALLELARHINLTPDVDLIYTDEVTIDEAGRSLATLSKPDYDEDLLLASNYIGNLVCVRRKLLSEVEALTSGRAGMWDLSLRIVERTSASRIRHIAKALHRARHRESADFEDDSLFVRLARDCVERRGLSATVEPGLCPKSVRLKRPVESQRGIALFTRLEHGDQRYAISRTNRPEGLTQYEVSFSSVYRLQDTSPAPILTWDDLQAEVLIFINRPLDTLSHRFLNELVSQCQRHDCGLVGQDAMNSEASAVRTVPQILPCYFAVKSALIADSDTWNLLCSGDWSQLCKCAEEQCRRQNLKIISTPYAIAQVRHGWD